MTREEFLAKYGTHGWQLLIGEFIRRAPEFPGDLQLADEIGKMVTDLSSVLEGGD